MMKKFTKNFKRRVGLKNYFQRIFILMVCFTSMNTFGQATWTDQVYNADVAGIENNPMKGWMPGYTGVNSTFPYSIDHFYIALNKVYTGWGQCNWTEFDTQLNRITSGGRHVVCRFWVHYPGSPTGLPSFLNSVVPTYSDDGSPDYNDPDFVLAMEDFIALFGARYNGDPRIVMVEAGLYGKWGEWHTSPETARNMTQTNKTRLITAYKNAFPNTHIGLRQSNHATTADKMSLGYYDDSFSYQTLCTGSWCFWNGNIVPDGITDIYKYHPIGGELRPEIQDNIFDAWPNATVTPSPESMSMEDLQTCINTTHLSFMKAFYLYKNVPTSTEWTNALRSHKMMGYIFYVRSVKLIPNANGSVFAEVNLQNRGVAPIYYNWQVELGAINTATSAFTAIGTANWNINGILPTSTDFYKSATTNALANGSYKILMRFKNPLDAVASNAKQLYFANSKQNADKSGWLTLGTVTTGVTTILPTSVSISPTTLTLTAIGNTGQLTATVLPTDATDKTVTWSSNPTSVATVNQSGVVTAVAAGNATITTTTVNGLTATCAVTVSISSGFNAFSQIEAESYSSMSGVQAETCTEGGQNIGWIENGDYIVFNNVNFGTGAANFEARVASGATGGSIEVRLGSITGTLVGTCAVTGTGGWQTWTTKSCAISGASGTQNLYLKFTGGTGYLFNLNWIKFVAGSLPDVTALTGWVSGTTNNKVAGSNRLMTVMVMGESNVNFSATGITYGGQTMTKQTEKLYYVGGNRTYASIFTLKETGVNAATNGTIAVSWSPTPSVGSSIYSVLLANVDQTTPVSSIANNGITSTSVTTSALSAASGDMIIAAGATENDGSITFNNGFTEAFETSGLSWGDACGGYKMGSGVSETPKYTQSASMRLALCAMVAKKATVLKSASIESSQAANKTGNMVKLYPNPVSSILNIDFSDSETMKEIRVFNSVGQLVYNNRTQNNTAQIDVQSLKIKGIACVQIVLGNEVSTHKIVVR